MPLKLVDLTKTLEPLQWFVPGLFLKGYLNFIASLPGHGKTALLTGLAWQATIPGGGLFLGKHVSPGAIIYVDYDAPGEGRSIRYWLNQHQAAYPEGDIGKIHVLEPHADTYGMGEGELEALTKTAEATKANLIIVDSFMAAFPNTNPSKLTEVQSPLWFLRRLANETNAAVVLVDHLPKPMTGEVAGARGVMGSVAKPAQARAVHVLSRVPKREVNGRNILRWDVQKMSYAALPEPFGVELRFDGEAVYIEGADLPQSFGETKSECAVRAMRNHLEENRNRVVSRRDLLEVAMSEGEVKDRTAKSALKDLLEALGDTVEETTLEGQGSPKMYRLKPIGGDPPPNTFAPLHQRAEIPLETEKTLGHASLHQSLKAAPKKEKAVANLVSATEEPLQLDEEVRI